MIKVMRHGNKITVVNPVDGSETEMRVIIFSEEGRTGADKGMAATSDFLTRITGENVGLSNLRLHSHPVRLDKVALFPIGKTYDGHINREMHSRPQMNQQEGVDSRLIDGKPTYFKTKIGDKPEEDVDLRDSNEVLAQIDINLLRNTRVGAAKVIVREQVGTIRSAPERIVEDTVKEGLTEAAV